MEPPSPATIDAMRIPWLLLAVQLFALPAHAEWVERVTDGIMGTRVVVELWADSAADGNEMIEMVLAEMRRIDAAMSTYKADSEVSAINRRAALEPVIVSTELFDLLTTAIDYSRITEGAFDITYASVGYLYDFRHHHHPDRKQIASALPSVDYRQLELNARNRSVHFARKGKVIARIPLEDAALSTSGDYERYFDENGIRYHHIIDPKTGDSARKVRSATIIGPTATRTDGLSKTAFVLGPQQAIEIYNRMDDIDAVLVTPDGQVLYTKGLEAPR